MKKNSGLKLAILIIAIVLISLISFVGIYKLERGTMKNIMPDYLVGKELNGTRLITFKVDDSNINSDLNKFINKTYIKQFLENVDIKILVKDATLINTIKEQTERYQFTLSNSHLFN